MTRPPILAVTGAAAAVLAGVGSFIVQSATRQALERDYAVRTATSAAAYLDLVARGTAPAGGDQAARLLVHARALAALPGWTPLVEVYLGTVPLVHDTAAALDPQILAWRGTARWMDGGATALLAGPVEGGEPIGAVRVHASLSAGAGLTAGLIGLLAVAALGIVASTVRGPGRRRLWAGAYVLAVVLVWFTGAATSSDLGARGTDQWLRETRLLLEDAGGRMARVGEAEAAVILARIGAGAALSPGDSMAVEPYPQWAGGREWEVIGARVGPGRWLSLRTEPGESRVPRWSVLALVIALLGPLGVGLAWWGSGAGARPHELGETVAAWAFLAPATAHVALFTLAPLGILVYAATHHWDPTSGTRPFVGLENVGAVVGDPTVWVSLWRTLLFALHVPIATATALGLALAVHRRPALVSRALLALPAAGSLVAAALVWKLLDRSVGWLDHPTTALVGVAVVAAWVQIGYQVPVFLAGLDRIPALYHDAARVDGAGAWQHFRRVTFPLLRPVVLFALVTGTIVAAQAFTLVFILTGGGPAGATDLIAYRIYRTAWVDGRFDIASALAILLAGVLLVFTWLQFRLLDGRVEHA